MQEIFVTQPLRAKSTGLVQEMGGEKSALTPSGSSQSSAETTTDHQSG